MDICYKLPPEFRVEADDGGAIAAEFRSDALVITITDRVNREEAYIEVAGAEIRPFFEKLTAVVLEREFKVAIGVQDENGARDGETLLLTQTGQSLRVELFLWGQPSDDNENATEFLVWLNEIEAHRVHVRLSAMALRHGILFR